MPWILRVALCPYFIDCVMHHNTGVIGLLQILQRYSTGRLYGHSQCYIILFEVHWDRSWIQKINLIWPIIWSMKKYLYMEQCTNLVLKIIVCLEMNVLPIIQRVSFWIVSVLKQREDSLKERVRGRMRAK